MAYRDSFGVEVEEDDYVLSASTSGGVAKLGRIYFAVSGRPMLRVERSNHVLRNKSSELGYMVVVLRKADGSVPAHVAGEVVG
ncbi:hypothetical protein ACF1DV_25970 [Streptomyces achromogenes]|uniref:hypothetical protein n=1 Tax=Streptomyces achromogenes TaxID=67255 RepID=UPI0036FCF2B3